MSEQLLPNFLKFPGENPSDPPKAVPVKGEVKLHQLSKRPTVAVNEQDENILDSEFVE
jgi:hypothetical protein